MELQKSISAMERDTSSDQYDIVGPHMQLGVEYERAGCPEQAKAEWRKTITLRPKNRVVNASIPFVADALFTAGQYKQAFSAYNALIYQDQGPDGYRGGDDNQASIADFKAGVELLTAGDYPAAQNSLERAVTSNPSLFEAHFLLGDVYYVLGNRPAAIRQWEETLLHEWVLPPSPYSRFFPEHWAALEMLIRYTR